MVKKNEKNINIKSNGKIKMKFHEQSRYYNEHQNTRSGNNKDKNFTRKNSRVS